MAKGKIILICQSGGEFTTNDDGTMSYEKGEANAVNVTQETVFDELKLEVAEMCNLDQSTIAVKYFLPGNRRTLITLRNDKDLKRLITFHENSVTAEIFVSGKEGFDHEAVKKQLPIEIEEPAPIPAPVTAPAPAPAPAPVAAPTPTPVAVKKQPIRKKRVKPAEKASHVSPSPKAAAGTVLRDVMPLRSYKNAASVTTPDASKKPSTTSGSSSENDSVSDSEYKPVRGAPYTDPDSPGSVDMDCSPADTVKKRRRTASWKIGAHVSPDSESQKKRKRKNLVRKPSSLSIVENSEKQEDDVLEIDTGGFDFYDSELPENLIAKWKEGITGVGQEFKSVKDFREVLQKYAVAHRFVYKLKKNDTTRANGVCVEEGCSWNIHASWVSATESFTIKEFESSHTCSGESWKNAHPAKKLMVSIIKDKLREFPHHKPKDIVKIISEDFGVQLSYTQAWRGIEEARVQLQGSYDESYNHLPWFCEKLMETNLYSFTKLVTNDEKRLQSLFFSFHPSIQSFLNVCRPILFLESTSLRSKYQEHLLTAIAVDGDDGFFPVAFCIVDNENKDTWHWFLEQLKSAISTTRALTFVSDWEKGLANSINEIFENNAYIGYSMYHLSESFKKTLKGPYHGEGRAILPGKLLDAARAVRNGGFKKYIDQIKHISQDAYDWLIQIPPENWANSQFKGERYNYIVENLAEPYTKLMDETRESTIMQKIEALLQMVHNLTKNRQTGSIEWTTKLTPSKERKVQEEAFKGKNLRVFISSDILFEVHDESTHVVNIEKWECTCLGWKETGLPCRHAIAALSSGGKNAYYYCSQYFTVENYQSTYGESINPIADLAMPWNEDADSADDVEILPPVPASPVKTEEPVKTENLDKRTVICSKCKAPGHNKASCKAVDSSSTDALVVVPPASGSPEKNEEQGKTEDQDKRTVTCSMCKEPGHNKASCKITLSP